MSVQTIPNPANGEGVVAVQPPLAPTADAGWHRRLNVFNGRALTAPALNAEQVGRAGRLAASAQALSPGVVRGLEVSLQNETPPGAVGGSSKPFLHITPGIGLAANGEDVAVPGLLRVDLDTLPVYGPVTLFGPPAPAPTLPPTPTPTPPEPAPPTGGPILLGPPITTAPPAGSIARQMGPTLGELRRNAAATPAKASLPPPAAVLVLQPVIAEFVGRFDNTDPCEQDPRNNAFENWQLVDGCRLVLYTWPAEWLPLTPDSGLTWRNTLANSIFEAERQRGPAAPPPWQSFGVPIALIAFGPGLTAPRFVDRYSVVRRGGRARSRTPLAAGLGTRFLWRARLQQFAAQMAAPDVQATSIGDLGKQFRFLPPAGLLPKEVLEKGAAVGTWITRFFPSSYHIQATPVPLEQLDLVLDASAHLAPFDATVAGEDVRLLVPVSQPWFEPGLLQVETVDPVFQKTLTDAVTARGVSLQRRQLVRTWASAIMKAITGRVTVYPDPDPDALESPETVGTAELSPAETPPTVRSPVTGNTVAVVNPLDDLKGYLRNNSPLTADELADLDAKGLDQFIVELQGKVNSSNDTLDFGFVRVQTDIYRHRQLILDNVSASRLATSPVLAGIAQGETAVATREGINTYLAAARQRQVAPIPRAVAPVANAPTIASFAAASPGISAGTTSVFASQSQPHTRFLSGDMLVQPSAGQAVVLTDTSTGIGAGGASSLGVARGADRVMLADGTLDLAFGGAAVAASSPLFTSGPTSSDIQQQAPIVGQTLLFETVDPISKQIRSVTVADRLKQPPAPEAKNYTVASKAEIMRNLASLPISIEDISVPGFLDKPGGVEIHRTFAEIKGNNMKLVDEIIGGLHDPDPALVNQTADEASWLAAGVKTLEQSIASLRLVEGRVHAYERAIDVCRLTIGAFTDTASQLDHRLKVIGDELGINRHAVATAQALLNDETDRANGINQRRDRIRLEHVPFIAFVRPRTVNPLTPRQGRTSVPIRALDPTFVETPVPDCLAQDETVPTELRAMVDLLREAPLSWFTQMPQLLHRIDRLDILRDTLLSGAKQRALTRLGGVSFGLPPVASGAMLAMGIASTFSAQRQVINQLRLQTSQLDLSVFTGSSWQVVRDQAQHVVSVGDLIDVSHGRSDVAQAAASELDSIARVATCLFNKLHAVLPSTRLVWAERLSQYDGAVDLSTLAQLPRWGSLDYLARQEMQSLADWLYQQVDSGRPGALAMMHDLVRVCVLLASHAPVDVIIAGHVAHPTPVTEGGRIHLAVDESRVRIGMHVLMYNASASGAVAHGVVEDLANGMAAARVLKSASTNLTLDAGARARFVEPSGFTSGLVRSVLS